MPNRPLLALVLSCLVISGCQSTTTGTTSTPRRQIMMGSSDALNQQAAQHYAHLLNQARAKGTLDTDQRALLRVQRITQQLINEVHHIRPDAVNWAWEIHIIDDKDANAFAMPGGKMIIYSGLIERLNLTDAELAAIIGHEMAHALREHSKEQQSTQALTQNILNIGGVLLGASIGQMQMASIGAVLGVTLPYSRHHEREADAISLELMARAGYHPASALDLWRKMIKEHGKGSRALGFLSTHPNPKTRLNTLETLLPTAMAIYE